jgi:peptide/nickel transport system substrate-binding protein
MRIRTGARLLSLVATGIVALAACGSGGGGNTNKPTHTESGFGSVPAQSGTPKQGGIVTMAQYPGADPNYIFPVTPAANTSVYTILQFQQLCWRPLYFSPQGTAPQVDYALSMADKPTFSADGKTVTIKMNSRYSWSDGQPVTAKDAIFFLDLLRAAVKESPANFGNYTPGQLPDNVSSAVATDDHTLTLTFDKVYNPNWIFLTQLQSIVPLPAHSWAIDQTGGAPLDYTQPANAKRIYDYLNKQSSSLATYATNPLWQMVDGPFKISAYNASTGAANFLANPAYTGPNKPHVAELHELAYTSTTAEFNDLRSGKLDAGYISADNIPQVPTLKNSGYNVYGLPVFGFNYIVFNFKDTTGHWNKIISQLYVRQALAHLIDQNAYVKGIYHDAAAPGYGPVPPVPVSPFAPANAKTAPYPYDVNAAKQLLTSHGWSVVADGQTTCTSPGSGPNQCGDGIPAGTPLAFNLIYTNSNQATQAQSTALASEAKKVGITVALDAKTFNFILQNYTNVSAPANADKWAAEFFGGQTQNLYPSSNDLFNTGGSFNAGGYSDPKADELIHNDVYSTDPNAVQKDAAYLTEQVPALFMPNNDRVWAWKNTLSGPPDAFAALTQFTWLPEQWYFKQ